MGPNSHNVVGDEIFWWQVLVVGDKLVNFVTNFMLSTSPMSFEQLRDFDLVMIPLTERQAQNVDIKQHLRC